MLLVCVYVHALCGLVPALLPRAFLYLAVRCVTGVCCCCINICSFSLGKELPPPLGQGSPGLRRSLLDPGGAQADKEHVSQISPLSANEEHRQLPASFLTSDLWLSARGQQVPFIQQS